MWNALGRIGCRFLLFWVSITGTGAVLWSSVYYVSPAGDDANPGTAGLPWKTIQKAANTMNAGDSAIILPGIYGQPVSISTRSGAANAPIIFQGDGDVEVTAAWNIGTYSTPRHYIVVRGLRFRGVTFDIRGDNNLVENCTFIGPSGGLRVSYHYTSDPPSNNVIIRGNTFKNFGQVVVLSLGTKSSNVVVEGNLWDNLEGDAIRPFGVGHIIRGNIVQGLRETGWHADIFQVYDNNYEQSLDLLIENNVFRDSTGSICMVLTSGKSQIGRWKWRNNLIVNVDGVCQVSAPYFEFHNNTFVNAGRNTAGPILMRYSGDLEYAYAHHTQIINNLFIGCGSYPDGDGNGWYHFADRSASSFEGFSADYNYVTKSGAAGFGAKGGFQGLEVNGINGGDPLFFNQMGNDFRLQAASRAVDRGIALAGFAYDIEGTVRPQGSGWDRGAYETAASGGGAGLPGAPRNLRVLP